MKKFICTIVTAGLLVFGIINGSYASTIVVEEISGSSGDWTYTYTITNAESSPIWQWAVWLPTDPNADSITAGNTDWAATNLSTQGFFPEKYTNDWGDPVYDSSGTPLDGDTTNETQLVGPNGEPGFYNTYANDFTSSNPGQYLDTSSWVNLPDPLPDWPDPIWEKIWRGEDYGWLGAGANIQTVYGIAVGDTGQFSFHSSELISDTKSFSYNTIGYWYSLSDESYNLYIDFEGSGTVAPIPEPGTMLLLGTGLIGLAGLRRKFKK